MTKIGFALTVAAVMAGMFAPTHPGMAGPLSRMAATFDAPAPQGNATLRDALPLVRYEESWIETQAPEVAATPQLECLTEALYFEARGESIRGQFAVAEVILNRVDSPKYPGTVCEVVNQGASQAGCQFSFACDGQPEVMRDPRAAERAERIAAIMLDGGPRILTMGATHFHTNAVQPAWARDMPHTVTIGDHLFYRE